MLCYHFGHLVSTLYVIAGVVFQFHTAVDSYFRDMFSFQAFRRWYRAMSCIQSVLVVFQLHLKLKGPDFLPWITGFSLALSDRLTQTSTDLPLPLLRQWKAWWWQSQQVSVVLHVFSSLQMCNNLVWEYSFSISIGKQLLEVWLFILPCTVSCCACLQHASIGLLRGFNECDLDLSFCYIVPIST